MADTTKLRECPFCGSLNQSIDVTDRSPNLFPFAAHVLCLSCLASVGSHGFEQTENEARAKAIAAWNRRAYDSMIISMGIEREVARRERDVAVGDVPRTCITCARPAVGWEPCKNAAFIDGGGPCMSWLWRGLPNAPTPPRTNFDAITESPEKLAGLLSELGYEGFCTDRPECAGALEADGLSADECKQCLVDWLNRSVDEQKKE